MGIIKRFSKKNKMIGAAITLIVVSTTIIAVAVNSAQAASVGKVVTAKIFNSAEEELTDRNRVYSAGESDTSKEEAIELSGKYVKLLFGFDMDKNNVETKFYREPQKADVNGYWQINGSINGGKSGFTCVIDSITGKIIRVNQGDNYKKPPYDPNKKQEVKELSKEDSESAKNILRNAMNDKKYTDKAKSIIKDMLGGGTSIVSARSIGGSMLYKGCFNCSIYVDKNGKEDFAYKQMPEGRPMTSIINIEIKLANTDDSKTQYFTFDKDTLILQGYSYE